MCFKQDICDKDALNALYNLSPLELNELARCCQPHPSWLINLPPQQRVCLIALPLAKHHQPANRTPVWFDGYQTAAESAATLTSFEHVTIRDIIPTQLRFLSDVIRLKILTHSIEENKTLADAHIFPYHSIDTKKRILSIMLFQRIVAFINPYNSNSITWQHTADHAVMGLKSSRPRAQRLFAIIHTVIKSKVLVIPSLKSLMDGATAPLHGKAIDDMISVFVDCQQRS